MGCPLSAANGASWLWTRCNSTRSEGEGSFPWSVGLRASHTNTLVVCCESFVVIPLGWERVSFGTPRARQISLGCRQQILCGALIQAPMQFGMGSISDWGGKALMLDGVSDLTRRGRSPHRVSGSPMGLGTKGVCRDGHTHSPAHRWETCATRRQTWLMAPPQALVSRVRQWEV